MTAHVPPELAPEDGYPTGPERLVLIGPPGCGKTRAALDRFAIPVLERFGLPGRREGEPPPPAPLLLVSFSRAAAGELRARLAERLGGDADDYRGVARTVHSEALRLVRSAGLAVKLPRHARRDEDDDDGLPDVALGAEDAIEAAASELRTAALRVADLARQRCERGDLRRAFALARPAHDFDAVMAEVRAYENEKRRSGAADFTDLLELALSVAPPDRELVLVDEAQDTSRLQWALLERWASVARRFVAIGDPDQAVHLWCGAAPERLIEHARAGAVRRLGQSHRVPASAHALARSLILLNRDRLDAPYAPADTPGVVREVDAAEAVASVSVPGREVLVLGRSRAVLARWTPPLCAAAIPFLNERGYSPLNGSSRRASARAVVSLRAEGVASLRDVKILLGSLPVSCFPPRSKTSVREEVGAWNSLRVTADELERAGVGLAAIRGATLRAALTVALGRHQGGDRVAADIAALVERHGPGVLDGQPSVTITTAHAAKGREAALVVLDLELPKQVLRALGEPGALQAERQLLYVALTRTKDELLLVRHGRRDAGALLGLRPVVTPLRARGAALCLSVQDGQATPCPGDSGTFAADLPANGGCS